MSYSDNLGYLNDSIYCGNCDNLSYNEKEQEVAYGNPDHECYKFNKKLSHIDENGNNHEPKILKCKECLEKRSK